MTCRVDFLGRSRLMQLEVVVQDEQQVALGRTSRGVTKVTGIPQLASTKPKTTPSNGVT